MRGVRRSWIRKLTGTASGKITVWVAATGFFEHREVRGFKKKVPYYIKLKDREIFFIAGLYVYSPQPDLETGEAIGTFTVITRNANELMKQIHNGGDNAGRMPLILPPGDEQQWLNPEMEDIDIHHILDYSLPPNLMEAWPVNSVRKAKPDNESVIEKIVIADLPELV